MCSFMKALAYSFVGCNVADVVKDELHSQQLSRLSVIAMCLGLVNIGSGRKKGVMLCQVLGFDTFPCVSLSLQYFHS